VIIIKILVLWVVNKKVVRCHYCIENTFLIFFTTFSEIGKLTN